MSEMTLKQAVAKLDSKLCTASEYAMAWPIVKAHLTRAPVQVTDDAIKVLDEHHQALLSAGNFTGEGPWFSNGEEMAIKEEYAQARASLSARLAQPVVASFSDDAIKAATQRAIDVQSSVPRDISPGDGWEWMVRKIADALLSQPHPQAAQGGEVQSVSMEIEDAWVDKKSNATLHVKILDGRIPMRGDKLYTHSAERAAVPEGWVLVPRIPTQAMCDAFMKEEDEADYSGGPREIIVHDVWRAVLTAAPTLDGKEKG